MAMARSVDDVGVTMAMHAEPSGCAGWRLWSAVTEPAGRVDGSDTRGGPVDEASEEERSNVLGQGCMAVGRARQVDDRVRAPGAWQGGRVIDRDRQRTRGLDRGVYR